MYEMLQSPWTRRSRHLSKMRKRSVPQMRWKIHSLPCLCDSCAALIQQEKQQEVKNREDQRRQKYQSALVDTRNEFIKTVLIGIVVGMPTFIYQVIKAILTQRKISKLQWLTKRHSSIRAACCSSAALEIASKKHERRSGYAASASCVCAYVVKSLPYFFP